MMQSGPAGTARDVATGLCFVAFVHEISLLYSVIYAELVIAHLVSCGFDLSKTTWQSDNGSEFVGSWQSSGKSAFIRLIERVPGQRHRAIPPGAHRFQSDVETVHSLEETEFFEVEGFTSLGDFLAKATAYMRTSTPCGRTRARSGRRLWSLYARSTRVPSATSPSSDRSSSTTWPRNECSHPIGDTISTLIPLGTFVDCFPRGEVRQRQSLYNQAFGLYRERPDLQMKLRMTQTGELVSAGRKLRALIVLVPTIVENAKEGTLVLPAMRMAVRLARGFGVGGQVYPMLRKADGEFPKRRGNMPSPAYKEFRELFESLR